MLKNKKNWFLEIYSNYSILFLYSDFITFSISKGLSLQPPLINFLTIALKPALKKTTWYSPILSVPYHLINAVISVPKDREEVRELFIKSL